MTRLTRRYPQWVAAVFLAAALAGCQESDVVAPDGATINFGEISPSNQGLLPSQGLGGCAAGEDTSAQHGAWQLYNNANEAWQFLRGFTFANPGRDIPRVRASSWTLSVRRDASFNWSKHHSYG